MGTHTSSVAPGKTVDSYMTKEPFERTFPIDFVASRKCFKSGLFLESTGVGTVTI